MLIESLINIFQPLLLIIILLGVSLGIIWGALPGLSTTMAMALLIGFTSTMEQDVAICFMLGVYTGSVFGGAISAILINIPGTPDAVPTMIEGHALAKKGEAGTALGTAIFGSFIGNWIGILILIFLMPFLIAIALNFKSWEMFLLSIIGISVCGTMCSGELPIKGWIVGWIGILIAMVGIDPIYGIERFTFNNPNFYDGFNYIPILIGLFGICEIVKTLPNKNKSPIPEKVGKLFLPLKKLFHGDAAPLAFITNTVDILGQPAVGIVTLIISGTLGKVIIQYKERRNNHKKKTNGENENENIKLKVEKEEEKYDVILSRAVAPLNNLLRLLMPISKKNTIFLLPKGKNYQKEIEKAKKLWKFSYKVVKNSLLLDKSGGVTLEIITLKKK